jgi:hypothetical protein
VVAAAVALAVAPAAAQAGTITVQVTGSGAVRDDQGRIDCPATACTASYNDGTVTFTAAPRDGASFQGWSGACSQFSGSTCTVNGGFDAEIGAAFTGASPPPPPPPPPPEEARRFPVSVLLTGPGSGRVGSVPAGIDCSRAERGEQTGTCSTMVREGETITLEHRGGGTFQSWGGACSGDQTTCRLVVRGPLDVTAFYWARPDQPGSVQIATLSGGTIAQVGTAIRCSLLCTFFGLHGEVLTFEPVARLVPRFPNSVDNVPEDIVFDGWSGGHGCTTQGRTGRCTVRINGIERHDVIARFRRKGSMRFRVRGLGFVRTTRRPTDATDRIECRTDCSVLLRDDEGLHTWDAEPEAGWRFSHWSGYCARILEDETCSAREERGTRASTATFVRDPGRGEARLAIHTSAHGTPRIVDVLDGERQVCPGACFVRAQRRSGGRVVARIAPRIPADSEFKRWENCPHVLAGRRGLDLCEIRSRDRVDGVIRAVVEGDPLAQFRASGQGRIRFGGALRDCARGCEFPIPRSATSARQATAVPSPGWYFSHYTGYCGEWFRSAGPTCFLRGLWGDETSTAVFRRLGTLSARVQGGGTLRAVFAGSGFATTERFSCRADSPSCEQANPRAPLYRRYEAHPDPGWRFSHWEGYCQRIFYNHQCDVPGDNADRATVAVFVR